MIDLHRILTDRLELKATVPTDAVELFPIMSDPAGWWFDPASRHTDLETTEAFVARAAARWDADGLSYWTVRALSDGRVIGIGGAQRHRTRAWNLSYRIATDAQGHGYATELATFALLAAHQVDADAPVIAWVTEENIASRAVAERVGLVNQGRFVDANDGVERLAFTDRALAGEWETLIRG